MNTHIRFLLLCSSLLTASFSSFGAAEAADDLYTQSYWDSFCVAAENGLGHDNPEKENGQHSVQPDYRRINAVRGVTAIVGPDKRFPLQFDQRRNNPGVRKNGTPVCSSHGLTPYDIAHFNLTFSIKNANKYRALIAPQLEILEYLSQLDRDTISDIWKLIEQCKRLGDHLDIIECLKTHVQNRLLKAMDAKKDDDVAALLGISDYLSETYPPVAAPADDAAAAAAAENYGLNDAQLAARLQAMEVERARRDQNKNDSAKKEDAAQQAAAAEAIENKENDSEKEAGEEEQAVAADQRPAAKKEQIAAPAQQAAAPKNCPPGGPSW